MAVWRDTEHGPDFGDGCAVTIGAYDGVHRGHRAVIAELIRRAQAIGVPSAVVTFDRHPATVVRPASAPKQLTDPAQEVELLAASGVDHVVVLTFDDARAKESAEDFVTGTLVGQLHTRLVLVGTDFRFGHERRGDVGLLARLGPVHGFETVGIELVDATGGTTADEATKVSSTAIRAALEAGDLSTATALLGRHHEIRGRVEADGTPGGTTAVVHVAADVQLPAEGVYDARIVGPDGRPAARVVTLGPVGDDPSGGRRLLLELRGADGASVGLDGEPVKVQFVERRGFGVGASGGVGGSSG